MAKFVTTFNQARDYYSLPLALHEIGLLERHVTDLYVPEHIAELSFAGRGLAKRSAEACLGLRQVSICVRCFTMQALR